MFPKYLERLKDIPVWVFHGEKDEAVPVEESLKAIESFNGYNLFSIDRRIIG
jgi:predicted peptidase